MGGLQRPKIAAWVHGGRCSVGFVASLQLAPIALQKALHGCTGALQRWVHCIPAAGTRCTPNVVAWAHGGVAERDSLHPSSCRCSHTLHHRSCCMGAWCCLIAGLVAFQQLLHTESSLHGCSVSLQHGTRCIPVPTAAQHPLHPSTNSSQCSLHPSTHCTPKDGCRHCSTHCIWHPLHGHVVAVHQQPLHPTA